MSGYKQTQGKLDMSLLPLRAQLEVCQVFHYGKEKYSRDNWLEGLKLSDLRQAQRRHEGKFDLGQPRDGESGLFHLAHKACLALMELELYLQGKLLDENGKPIALHELKKPIDELFKPQFNSPTNVLNK